MGVLEEKYNCRYIIVAGDFNLVFKQCEVKNRAITAQEGRIAKIVSSLYSQFSLVDALDGKENFTWN